MDKCRLEESLDEVNHDEVSNSPVLELALKR